MPRNRKVEPWRRDGRRPQVARPRRGRGLARPDQGRPHRDRLRQGPARSTRRSRSPTRRSGTATSRAGSCSGWPTRCRRRVDAPCLRVAREAEPARGEPVRVGAARHRARRARPRPAAAGGHRRGRLVGRPDLVDVERRGWSPRPTRSSSTATAPALRRDCERYKALALRGWLVLRFSWEHVDARPRLRARLLRGGPPSWRPPRRATSPRRGRRTA